MRILGILALAAAGCVSDASHPPFVDWPSDYHCVGTEPFWSLFLTSGEAVLRQVTAAPEPQETKFNGNWNPVDADDEFTWRGESEKDGTPFEVTITRAACRGTRDEPYAYQSSLGTNRANGVFEPGCCDRR